MKNRIYLKAMAFLICLIGISVLLFVVFGLIENVIDKAENNITPEDVFSYSEDTDGLLYYENTWYAPKDSLESILILGIDKKLMNSSEDRQNSRQADYLALLILDKETQTFRILHLNRDTMTDIPQTDITGREYRTIYAQLALAHTYGSDDRARCRNTVNTVENLLYGIEIDHYLSLTMDAVPILNDSVGGVELQLMDDFTDLDESFIKDAVVTLYGEQALAYVQARGSLEDSTNLHRMERQRQYLSALLEKYCSMNMENTTETMMQINEYMVSDCTIDQLSRLLEKLGSYTYGGILTLDGEAVRGEEFMEYYINESAVQKLVVELFYEHQKEA